MEEYPMGNWLLFPPIAPADVGSGVPGRVDLKLVSILILQSSYKDMLIHRSPLIPV